MNTVKKTKYCPGAIHKHVCPRQILRMRTSIQFNTKKTHVLYTETRALRRVDQRFDRIVYRQLLKMFAYTYFKHVLKMTENYCLIIFE